MKNRGSRSPVDLAGTTVLVVEDEFYLAMDLKEGIERAGGTVLGPCADVAGGLAQLEGEAAHCAVVDINLGEGPSFAMAEELVRRRLPFLLLTGYDAPTIPAELAHIERIEKPAEIERVLAAVAALRSIPA